MFYMTSYCKIAALEVVRSRGLFGRVTVLYEVESSGSNGRLKTILKSYLERLLFCIDLSMSSGGIIFEAGIDSMVRL